MWPAFLVVHQLLPVECHLLWSFMPRLWQTCAIHWEGQQWPVGLRGNGGWHASKQPTLALSEQVMMASNYSTFIWAWRIPWQHGVSSPVWSGLMDQFQHPSPQVVGMETLSMPPRTPTQFVTSFPVSPSRQLHPSITDTCTINPRVVFSLRYKITCFMRVNIEDLKTFVTFTKRSNERPSR